MRLRFSGSISLLVLVVLFVAVAGVLVGSAVNKSKTPGVPPPPPYSPLPPAGGWPEASLRLEGTLTYDTGTYKLEVSAVPGYVVPLRFAASGLEAWAAAHIGERVSVSGYWDNTEPSIFVVESIPH
jgi:hypothetical protein